jgi:flavin-binding protein dodecin
MPKKEGTGKDLAGALDKAAQQLTKDELGWYTVEKIEVNVGNPKINDYKVTISR